MSTANEPGANEPKSVTVQALVVYHPEDDTLSFTIAHVAWDDVPDVLTSVFSEEFGDSLARQVADAVEAMARQKPEQEATETTD